MRNFQSKWKLVLVAIVLLWMIPARAMATTGSNSEPVSLPDISVDDIAYRILTARPANTSLESMLDEDKKRKYIDSIHSIYNESAFIDKQLFQQLLAILKYDLNSIPSSENTGQEWMEIAKVFSFMVKAIQQENSQGTEGAFRKMVTNKPTVILSLLSDTAFVLRAYPESTIDLVSFWKREAKSSLIKLQALLNALPGINESADNLARINTGCKNTFCLKQTLSSIGSPHNTWLSTARITYTLLKSFNPEASMEEPMLFTRQPLPKGKRSKMVMRFLTKNDKSSQLKTALAHITKRLEKINFPFWRFKATQYFTALMDTMETDYHISVSDNLLSKRQQSILGRNAQLVDHALAVEGFCPLQWEKVCSFVPVNTNDVDVIRGVNVWHQSPDLHIVRLYDSQKMFELSLKLAHFAGLGEEELTLSPMTVVHLDYSRKNAERIFTELDFITKLFGTQNNRSLRKE